MTLLLFFAERAKPTVRPNRAHDMVWSAWRLSVAEFVRIPFKRSSESEFSRIPLRKTASRPNHVVRPGATTVTADIDVPDERL